MSQKEGSFVGRLADLANELHGPFVASVEAENFVATMERDHPDELTAWMRAFAVQHATDQLTTMLRGRRGRAFLDAERGMAGKAARAFAETADESVLAPYRTPLLDVQFVVDAQQNRKPLREMSGTECGRAADLYAVGTRTRLAREAFMRALAKRAGRRKIGNVLSDDDADRLWRSLSGEPVPQAA